MHEHGASIFLKTEQNIAETRVKVRHSTHCWKLLRQWINLISDPYSSIIGYQELELSNEPRTTSRVPRNAAQIDCWMHRSICEDFSSCFFFFWERISAHVDVVDRKFQTYVMPRMRNILALYSAARNNRESKILSMHGRVLSRIFFLLEYARELRIIALKEE